MSLYTQRWEVPVVTIQFTPAHMATSTPDDSPSMAVNHIADAPVSVWPAARLLRACRNRPACFPSTAQHIVRTRSTSCQCSMAPAALTAGPCSSSTCSRHHSRLCFQLSCSRRTRSSCTAVLPQQLQLMAWTLHTLALLKAAPSMAALGLICSAAAAASAVSTRLAVQQHHPAGVLLHHCLLLGMA